jgi:hypothetical protein
MTVIPDHYAVGVLAVPGFWKIPEKKFLSVLSGCREPSEAIA